MQARARLCSGSLNIGERVLISAQLRGADCKYTTIMCTHADVNVGLISSTWHLYLQLSAAVAKKVESLGLI